MNFHRESRLEQYDVIVIGAGVGGLAAGALLAKLGRSVLVIERHDRPGGYMHGFSRRGWRFDSGVHAVGGCASSGPAHRRILALLVEHLGLSSKVAFFPLDPVAHVFFPAMEIALPQEIARFESVVAENFPAQADQLRAFLALTVKVADETSRSAAGQIQAPGLFHQYRQATLGEVLDGYFEDDAIKAVLGALWPYLGLPPGQLSFLYWALMFVSYFCDGAGYCRGSFQTLADALAGSIQSMGGELLYRMGVRRILTQNGRAVGVATDTGQEIRAPVVISNVDLFQTFQQMLPADQINIRFLKRLRRLQPSVSAFVVYLATDRNMTDAQWHESFHFPHFDHGRHFQATEAGEVSWFSITIPTHTDPTLAPGRHLVMLTTLAHHRNGQSWRTAKQAYCDRLLALAEDKLPGLNDHLLLVESGTPRTLERYTLNHHGAAYGWAPTPAQIGPGRPGPKTPVEGLYLASHWSAPGGGVYGAALSGVMAAQAITGIPNQDSLWERLG